MSNTSRILLDLAGYSPRPITPRRLVASSANSRHRCLADLSTSASSLHYMSLHISGLHPSISLHAATDLSYPDSSNVASIYVSPPNMIAPHCTRLPRLNSTLDSITHEHCSITHPVAASTSSLAWPQPLDSWLHWFDSFVLLADPLCSEGARLLGSSCIQVSSLKYSTPAPGHGLILRKRPPSISVLEAALQSPCPSIVVILPCTTSTSLQRKLQRYFTSKKLSPH